jgi:hypothetical protein
VGGTNHAEERQPASETLGLFAPWECALKRTCGEKVVALPALPALYTAYGLSWVRLELRRHKLALCYYLALKCPQHGEMRAAVKRVPDGSYRCPLCRVMCGWTLLGAGGTHKQLPFFDELHGPDLHSTTVKAYWDDRKAKTAAQQRGFSNSP